MSRPIAWSGAGLHTGVLASVTVRAAPTHHGLTFRLTVGGDVIAIRATPEFVGETTRRTELRKGNASVSTVEHLLAALYACGVDDATIEVSGPEIPLLDGSAKPFADDIMHAGLEPNGGHRYCWSVVEPMTLEVDDAWYQVTPGPHMSLDVTIEFEHPNIGVQTFAADVSPHVFAADIAAARTFGFIDQRHELEAQGLIQGVAPHNVLLLTRTGLWNDQEFRWPDECARHKALDLLGDLALLGAPVLATIRAIRPSHRGNVQLARTIADVATRRRLDDALTV